MQKLQLQVLIQLRYSISHLVVLKVRQVQQVQQVQLVLQVLEVYKVNRDLKEILVNKVFRDQRVTKDHKV